MENLSQPDERDYVATITDNKTTIYPPTPARYEPMPQTREYWEKRAHMDQDLILKMKNEISLLKRTINMLRQKLKSNNPTE